MDKFFRVPFATSGDKTTIPDDVDVNGNVSFTQGYGFDYQRQKTDPAAKNIERDKMNDLFFAITTAIAEIQARGVPDFITSALNGGTAYSYAANALVRWTDDAVYISLQAANTATPADATKWTKLPTPARLQAAANTSAVAAGTADAITAAFVPAIAALPAAPGTLSVLVRAGTASTSTAPTFSPDGLTAKTIVKGNNQPLAVGDVAGAGHWLDLQYDATLDKWVLQNPAKGVVVSSPPQIQSISATVAANALTLGRAAAALDFRNAALTNGAPNAAINVGALSLVVPSGATLGTINGQQARLLLLVAYNGGSPVLCVTNIAGGVNLDETTLISPTTIDTTSDSASVIYSASAVGAGSPFRVVGEVEITEATAGTWATGPTLVQGVGGQALAALQSLGYGQTPQVVTGSRAIGTTYYNTTGRPLWVSILGTNNAAQFNVILTVGGVTINGAGGGINLNTSSQFLIPPGASYVLSGVNVLSQWVEYR